MKIKMCISLIMLTLIGLPNINKGKLLLISPAAAEEGMGASESQSDTYT